MPRPIKPASPKIIKNPDDIEDPQALVGMFDVFKAVSVTDFGAFLDWGFPKDLFVPWVEQQRKMKVGEPYLVYIYCDEKSGRLAGSSKVEGFLSLCPSHFKENDPVDLLICEQTDLGYKAIVNNICRGLLYKNEVFQPLRYGQRTEGYIKKIREDGNVDLCLQKPGYDKVEGLAAKILVHLNACGGKSDLTDKSSPAKIHGLFGASKKSFKMAAGLLYKQKKISIEPDGIKLLRVDAH